MKSQLERTKRNNLRLRLIASVTLGVLLLLAGTIKLESVPPLMWDEGWTLSVARNWVELDHYGRLLNGDPHSAGLSGHFPNVASVALSFRLFGVGIWQGRLPGVLLLFGSLALIFYLADRLYGRAIAFGTLVVLMLMPGHIQLHPMLLGRQITGDVPMVFYLLAGYALFLLALRRSIWWMFPAVILWGVALLMKAQVLPFWLSSLLIPFGFALLRRWWRIVFLLIIGLVGSWMSRWLIVMLQGIILRGHMVPGDTVIGLYDITATVLSPSVRQMALKFALTFGLPTLCGLSYAAWNISRDILRDRSNASLDIVRISLLTLAGSWYTWYAILGAFWPRYLFPSIFIGSIFVSSLLYELSSHFDFSLTIRRASRVLRLQQFNPSSLNAVLIIVLIAMTVPFTILLFFQSLLFAGVPSTRQVADFLNHQTPVDALIETYESELFFMLDRQYNYPPDQIHVELIRRGYYLDEDIPIEYDPLIADPDYLVIGTFSRLWRFYDDVLATGEFRLLLDFPDYQIYERVRNKL